MLEVAAALSAGLGTFGAIIAVAVPAPLPEDPPSKPWILAVAGQWWSAEESLARSAGWLWLTARRLAVVQLAAAIGGGAIAGGSRSGRSRWGSSCSDIGEGQVAEGHSAGRGA